MPQKLCKNRSLLTKYFIKHIPQLAASSLDTSLHSAPQD